MTHKEPPCPSPGSGPIYVVVCANDIPHPRFGLDPNGEIIYEAYAKQATREQAEALARVRHSHGKCRIARLVFDVEAQLHEDMLRALMQWLAAELSGDADALAGARAARALVLDTVLAP